MANHELHDQIQLRVQRASDAMRADGMAGIRGEGRLLRPLVAVAGMRDRDQPTDRFWQAVLAVQLAHEASLVHDDVVDGAAERRGNKTAHAERGVAAALLEGDHLLTTAYRAAANTQSVAFFTAFSRAVERTVAGEAAQARVQHASMNRTRYNDIVLGKSGELLGCALATAALLDERTDADAMVAAGRHIGLLYQMLDDLLDYCPNAQTGKPPLADYRQQRWTWIQDVVPQLSFALPDHQVLTVLHACVDGQSAMMRGLGRLSDEATTLEGILRDLLPDDTIVAELVAEWMHRAHDAVTREAALESLRASSGPRVDESVGYMSLHSKSFRLASRFFHQRDAARVARVYAFCRATDNLADRPDVSRINGDVLDAWSTLARRAYAGHDTSVAFVNEVMREMAAAGVPFSYVSELIEGMRMDLNSVQYATMDELRLYTYRVASVVGLWLTRLHGVHDPALLERAERLGHAMQLTNIARDVGEDWRNGRVYIPATMLDQHHVTVDDIALMCDGTPLSHGYKALIEDLMQRAESDYRMALDVIPQLPESFARPVAVAAHVYRGIHDDIRKRGYDNLRQRAHTSRVTKGRLAATALWTLRTGRATQRSPDTYAGRPTLVPTDAGRGA